MSHCKDPVHSKTVAKLEFQGASYHVIVRDNHRHDFFGEESDRIGYLKHYPQRTPNYPVCRFPISFGRTTQLLLTTC